MLLEPNFFYRPRLALAFLLVKLKPLQVFTTKQFRSELPSGWNSHMFWVAFKSNGKRIFPDYYCKLNKPTSFQPKLKVDDAYQLKSADIQHFYENGFIKPFKVISPEEAQKVTEHLVNMVTKKSKIHDEDSIKFYENEDSNGEVEYPKEFIEHIKKQVNKVNRHLEDEILLNLFKHPSIVERCAQLLGPNLLIWRSIFFSVKPKTTGTLWHQANTWLFNNMKESVLNPPDPKELFQLTAWVALTDTTKKKACMKFVRNSQWEIHPTKLTFNSTGEYSQIYGKYDMELDYPIQEEDINYVEMKAGECIIFSERAVHGSTDNQTNKWRWGVNARYVTTDTKIYSDEMLEEGEGFSFYELKKNFNLENWKAILVRGKDNGLNRLC